MCCCNPTLRQAGQILVSCSMQIATHHVLLGGWHMLRMAPWKPGCVAAQTRGRSVGLAFVQVQHAAVQLPPADNHQVQVMFGMITPSFVRYAQSNCKKTVDKDGRQSYSVSAVAPGWLHCECVRGSTS